MGGGELHVSVAANAQMPDNLPADLETRLESRGRVVSFEAGDVASRTAVDDPVGGAGGVVGFVAELAHEEVEEPHDCSDVFLFLLIDFGTGYFVGELVGREWIVFKCWVSLAHYPWDESEGECPMQSWGLKPWVRLSTPSSVRDSIYFELQKVSFSFVYPEDDQASLNSGCFSQMFWMLLTHGCE